MRVKAALISGPMYDPLYTRLPAFTQATGIEVEIAFRGDHPTLNEHLAHLSDVPYDLVSTHIKYAPSQLGFLAPLDGLIPATVLADVMPRLLSLVQIGGKLYALPRNVDLRLLHYRTDLLPRPPAKWDELLDMARALNRPPHTYGFVLPGMESGLFGTFFELAEMGGARLFPPDLTPQIENDGGRWALHFLRTCYSEGLIPPEIVDWHYDKVHDCFRDGHAAMVGDWPGYYADYCDPHHSAVHDRFAVARYPVGPQGVSLVYSGSHSFALTRRGVQKPEAVQLLLFLTAHEQQLQEARQGSVPVRQSVLRAVQEEATGAARARLETLEIAMGDVLVPPKFARYPEVEEVLWKTVQAAMTGRISIDAALAQMTRQIHAIVMEA